MRPHAIPDLKAALIVHPHSDLIRQLFFRIRDDDAMKILPSTSPYSNQIGSRHWLDAWWISELVFKWQVDFICLFFVVQRYKTIFRNGRLIFGRLPNWTNGKQHRASNPRHTCRKSTKHSDCRLYPTSFGRMWGDTYTQRFGHDSPFSLKTTVLAYDFQDDDELFIHFSPPSFHLLRNLQTFLTFYCKCYCTSWSLLFPWMTRVGAESQLADQHLT